MVHIFIQALNVCVLVYVYVSDSVKWYPGRP